MIRGRTRGIHESGSTPPPSMTANIHNRFDIEIIDSKTGQVKQRAQAENIILNSFWSSIPQKWAQAIHYGTGTGSPSPDRTSLFSYGGYKSLEAGTITIPSENTIVRKSKAVILETEAVGLTITEVGIARSSASNSLVTHAMLKDMNGNPISIKKTSTDILNIYATVFLHLSPEALKCIPLYNIPYAFTNSPSLNPLFACLLGNPSGKSWDSLNHTFLSKGSLFGYENPIEYGTTVQYVPNSKSIKITVKRVAASQGNNPSSHVVLTNYESLSYNSYYHAFFTFNVSDFIGPFRVSNEPLGTGDGVTKDFKTSFGRISNVRILVDGVEPVGGVTIDTNRPFLFKLPPNQTLISGSSFLRPYVLIDSELWTLSEYSHYGTSSSDSLSGLGILHREGGIGRRVFENLYNNIFSITKITKEGGNYPFVVEMSNDLSEWTPISLGSTIPPEIANSRYLKIEAMPNYRNTMVIFKFEVAVNGNPHTSDANIHFETPPPAGAVITVDYDTKDIPKDTNHVFDFSAEIKLGEYAT